jgi:hypothetical protein
LLVEDQFRIPSHVSYGLNSSTGRYEQRYAVVTVIVCTLLRKNIASSRTVKKRKKRISGDAQELRSPYDDTMVIESFHGIRFSLMHLYSL